MALLIGFASGITGSGGSILMMPVLVYLLNLKPVPATAYSLFIVGVTCFAGGFRAAFRGQMSRDAVLEFGIPSVFGVFLSRHYLLRLIPDHLVYLQDFEVTKNNFLMLLLAIFMILAAICLLKKQTENNSSKQTGTNSRYEVVFPVLWGFGVGLLVGVLGAGGGFLIIPVLVMRFRLHLKVAIGSSFIIITMNAVIGVLISLREQSFNWQLLTRLSLLSVAGVFAGSRFSDFLTPCVLKRLFTLILFAVAALVIVHEFCLGRG